MEAREEEVEYGVSSHHHAALLYLAITTGLTTRLVLPNDSAV